MVVFFGGLLIVGAEIAAFVAVAEQIGFVWALALLIVVSALGPFVVRRVGLGVVANTRERVARGELPTRELLDGVVVLIGGVLICVPGFVGDAIGLLLMIGPVRQLVIRTSGRQLSRRIQRSRAHRWRVVATHSRPTPPDRRLPQGPPSSPPESATPDGN